MFFTYMHKFVGKTSCKHTEMYELEKTEPPIEMIKKYSVSL